MDNTGCVHHIWHDNSDERLRFKYVSAAAAAQQKPHGNSSSAAAAAAAHLLQDQDCNTTSIT
jgi:hypothetical protein